MSRPTAPDEVKSVMRITGIAAVLALALAALLGLSSTASARGCASASLAPAKVRAQATANATLCLLNVERKRHGLRPFVANSRLSRAARRHSADMASRNYFDHNTLGGGDFLGRIRRAGYLSGARRWTAGENIAWGSGVSSTPAAIHRSWMTSPGHRANILSPAFREIGVGIVHGTPLRGGRGGATYTTNFGARG